MHFFQILSKIKQSYYFSSRQGAYQIWPTGSIFLLCSWEYDVPVCIHWGDCVCIYECLSLTRGVIVVDRL